VTLDEQLRADLKDAMVSGDTRRRDVIRFLRAAIKNRSIEQRRDLTDEEIQEVIRYQVKQRRDSIALFRSGGRDELAAEEEAQIAILIPYLPTQLEDEVLRSLVRDTVGELNVTSPRDMGRVMPAVLAKVAGRAENRIVSQLVKDELARRAAAES
jgi:uncharacterized protein